MLEFIYMPLKGNQSLTSRPQQHTAAVQGGNYIFFLHTLGKNKSNTISTNKYTCIHTYFYKPT